jgi:glycerol-3-phosphate dehydrogenase
MAKDAIDSVADALDGRVPPSTTKEIPLLGAVGYHALKNQRNRLAASSGLHVARIDHLLGRYGSLVTEVLALVVADPSLGQPLEGAPDFLRAEVVYATSHEGARHVEDVLARRTRISIETWDRGLESALPTAQLMAPVLGWSDDDVDLEVKRYHARVAAERTSQEMPDDESADAARLTAPEVEPLRA